MDESGKGKKKQITNIITHHNIMKHYYVRKLKRKKKTRWIITWCLPHCSQEEHGTYVTVLPVSTISANICAGVPIQSRVV